MTGKHHNWSVITLNLRDGFITISLQLLKVDIKRVEDSESGVSLLAITPICESVRPSMTEARRLGSPSIIQRSRKNVEDYPSRLQDCSCGSFYRWICSRLLIRRHLLRLLPCPAATQPRLPRLKPLRLRQPKHLRPKPPRQTQPRLPRLRLLPPPLRQPPSRPAPPPRLPR